MRITKTFLVLLSMAAVLSLLAQPVVQAAEGVDLFPVESDARGARSNATFALHEEILEVNSHFCYDPGTGISDDLTRVYFFLRVQDDATREWVLITSVAGTFCLAEDALDGTKAQALIDFLNEGRVLSAICPSCPPGSYVHLKSVDDDVHNYAIAGPTDPLGVMADFLLVVNQTPVGWVPPE